MVYSITEYDESRIENISKAFYPFEICGLIGYKIKGNQKLIHPYFLKNNAPNPRLNFIIKQRDFLHGKNMLLQNGFTFCGFIHSHPSTYATPTRGDRNVRYGNTLWLIYSVCYKELRLYKWDGIRFIEALLVRGIL